MTDTQETGAEVIAEYRADADKMDSHELPQPTTQYLRIMLDRFEAAHKRDCAKIEADALTVGGIVEAERKRERGDAAKLREALEALMIDFDSNYADDDDIASWCDVNVETVRKARAALAAPPRNCDLPEVAKDPWRAWLDDKSNWDEFGSPKLEIHDWLLAPATEKEGGAK